MVVNFPNGTKAISIQSGLYQPAPEVVPVSATVFKNADMQTSLIGLSDLCHNGQEIRLSETALEIIKDGKRCYTQQSSQQTAYGRFPNRMSRVSASRKTSSKHHL